MVSTPDTKDDNEQCSNHDNSVSCDRVLVDAKQHKYMEKGTRESSERGLTLFLAYLSLTFGFCASMSVMILDSRVDGRPRFRSPRANGLMATGSGDLSATSALSGLGVPP
jgi:hypothetical protein